MRPWPLLLLATAALAACGTSARPTPAARHATPRPASPCRPQVAAAVGPHADARVAERSYGVVTCAYAAGARRVRVTVDTLPQAQQRFGRAEVETWQNTGGWAHFPRLRPRPKGGIGVSAYWVPGHRELVTTDGPRLVTVRVVRPRGAPAWPLARRVARAALAR